MHTSTVNHGNRAHPALTRQCTQRPLLALRGERTVLHVFARFRGPKFYGNFTTLLPCLYDTGQCPRLYSSSLDMNRGHPCVREQDSPGANSVPVLRVVHPPPGDHYADQSCRRDCIPASLSHGGNTIAGQSAGLQSLLARDYPPEFWAGFRRGPSALPRPLCIHRVYRVHHGAYPCPRTDALLGTAPALSLTNSPPPTCLQGTTGQGIGCSMCHRTFNSMFASGTWADRSATCPLAACACSLRC
jgi:hypothetical protein